MSGRQTTRRVQMPCPRCGTMGAGVVDTRPWNNWQRRVRECVSTTCNERWATLEIPASLLESLPKLTEELTAPLIRMQAMIEAFSRSAQAPPDDKSG